MGRINSCGLEGALVKYQRVEAAFKNIYPAVGTIGQHMVQEKHLVSKKHHPVMMGLYTGTALAHTLPPPQLPMVVLSHQETS